MKNLIIAVAVLVTFSSILGCSDDPPSVQVANQRATKANVQFKQADGNTINLNDVSGSTTTTLQDIGEGVIVVTAVIQNEPVSPTTTFVASNDNNHTIVILAGDPPTLRVDTRGK